MVAEITGRPGRVFFQSAGPAVFVVKLVDGPVEYFVLLITHSPLEVDWMTAVREGDVARSLSRHVDSVSTVHTKIS